MASVKQKLLNLYYWGNLSREVSDANQRVIRDVEWNAVKLYIAPGSKFLDVGCGAGYAMKKASEEFGCDCYGIDPDPGAHGVGRYISGSSEGLNILQGFAENLPYADNEFDIVYSSHVLEHVNNEQKSLLEMKRVLKPNGILIIGMPTAAMAYINWATEFLFTTHQRFANIFLKPFVTTGHTPFINLFLPGSHSSHRAKTILFDICHYRVVNWEKIVSRVFSVTHTLLPALYPYPQYRQFFSMRKAAKCSSSVFFICINTK